METVRTYLDEQRSLLAVDFIALAFSDEESKDNIIRWRYASGNLKDTYQKIRLQIGKGIAGIVWRTGRAYIAENIFLDQQKRLEFPVARMEKLDAAGAVPVFSADKVVAVLLIGYRSPHQFSKAEMTALSLCSKEVSRILNKEEKLNEQI